MNPTLKIFLILFFASLFAISCTKEIEEPSTYIKDGRWQVNDSIYLAVQKGGGVMDTNRHYVKFNDVFGNSILFHLPDTTFGNGVFKVVSILDTATMNSKEIAVTVTKGTEEYGSRGRIGNSVQVAKFGNLYKFVFTDIEVRDSSGNGRITKFASGIL